jgi:hypothetical protein
MGLHLVNGKRKQERENKEFRVFVFFFLLQWPPLGFLVMSFFLLVHALGLYL